MRTIPEHLLGLSNKEIAFELGISVAAVSFRRKRMNGECKHCRRKAEAGAFCAFHHLRHLGYKRKWERSKFGHDPWQPGSRGKPPLKTRQNTAKARKIS